MPFHLGLGVTETKSSSGREGGRSLKTRVKTARKRSLSSTLWLERQLNDPYVARAKREGFRSRAAYKLIEIDERYHFLKSGQRVVDLGAAPGGWSQVAAGKVGAVEGKGRVIGIDLLDMEPLPGVEFKVMDFLIRGCAASSSWNGSAARPMLCFPTWRRMRPGTRKPISCGSSASWNLPPISPARFCAGGGAFLAKVIQGGTEQSCSPRLKREFAVVRHVKPQASRAGSAELYVLATGFRGGSRAGTGNLLALAGGDGRLCYPARRMRFDAGVRGRRRNAAAALQ